ncbi:MAG: phage portal protein [Planctomycetota bacterium]
MLLPWRSKRKDTAPRERSYRVLRAKFDAAQTTDENRRHWASADLLSADAAASMDVRAILRSRARYEVANNSYARGIVLTLANDTIGTGPRLQMLTDDPAANAAIEQTFMRWATSVSLPEKLRTMRMARAESGEAFAVLTQNPGIDHPVQLDVRLIEADQVSTPLSRRSLTDDAIDGIEHDQYGNPVAYHVLKHHPGDTALGTAGFGEGFDRVPAGAVVHLYRADRPGQSRGIPELTPALPLFAQLRRYRLAVLAAAETAADFALALYTDAPPNGEPDAVEPMDVFELEARMATTLPQGWKLGQVKAEHPSTNHVEFVMSILAEIARCLNMPFNVAAGNSSGYNYASGRLDHQTYYKAIRVDQSHIAAKVLDPILRGWLNEAILVSDLLPRWVRTADFGGLPHQWFWDGTEHVDPAKEANAQATRLSSHTTTLANEYAKQGRDWETELRQRAKEIALVRELGLIPAPTPGSEAPGSESQASPASVATAPDKEDDDG